MGGATQYFLSDRLSVRALTDTSGNIVGRQGHLPFGEDFAESGTQEKHHFTSYELDTEAGTDYAVNRQYSQSIGRFNRPDPLASTGKKESPQTWNRYTYSMNEPINLKDPWGLFYGFSDNPCDPFGPTVILDGIELIRDFFCVGLIAAPFLIPGPDPAPQRTPCSEQDFTFLSGSLVFTAEELSELAQMAVGEAGVGFDEKEIEAVIATAINRLNLNKAYVQGGATRGPFNGGTSLIGILQAGYVATQDRSGEKKLAQAKALTGGILYEGDYVCSQLKAAKTWAVVAGELPSDALFSLYPFTYNKASRGGIERDAVNITRYGHSWFYFRPLPPP